MLAALDLVLGPHEALRHRRLGHEEGPGDLGGLQPGDEPQGEGHLGARRERRVAAREDQAELVVGHGADLLGFVGFLHAHGLGLAVVAGGLPADLVDPPVAGGRDDPAGRARRQAGLRPPLQRDHEGVLDRFLGEVDVAEEADQAGHRSSRTRRGRPARCRTCRPAGTIGSGLGLVLERAHLDGAAAGGAALGRPLQGGVEVGGLDHPEAADLLLGLGERPVGDEDVAALGGVDDGGGVGGLRARRRTPRRPASWSLALNASTAANASCISSSDGYGPRPRPCARRAGTGSCRISLVVVARPRCRAHPLHERDPPGSTGLPRNLRCR